MTLFKVIDPNQIIFIYLYQDAKKITYVVKVWR
jgi:hypothetical protein